MKVVYGKQPNIEEFKKIMQISLECGISTDTARLLFCREIDTPAKVKRFLNPSAKGFNSPLLLNDVALAVERITLARDSNENVLIFGDYDADGVCATTVLYNCLKIFGITARTVIPERDDGYGLNEDVIANLNAQKPIDLIITVDCGISDFEKIENIKKSGIEVIVTDHHEPPEVLPNCLKINPKIKGQDYPFDGLCGAGVAYKLGYALIGERANAFLDYVALATVADSMDLIDENRDIVHEGLALFAPNKIRAEFKYLIGDNSKQVTAQTLAYNIAPRINAGGRMGDAATSLRLLLATTEEEKFNLAVKLNEYNIARQVECDNIYRQSKEKIKADGALKDDILLVYDENWSTGFVGIVASRLVEEYARPVIVFAGHGDLLKGSARSVDGLNIFEAISSAKDVLVAFGGHSQAAGVTVEKSKFQALKSMLNRFMKERHGKLDVERKIAVEWEIEEFFSIRFARELELLEPFGVGNRKPLFATKINEVKSSPLKMGSPHYSFKTEAMEMLDFNGEQRVSVLGLPITKTIVFEPNLSIFNKKENLKGYVKSVIPDYSDLSKLEYRIFENELNRLKLDGAENMPDATADDLNCGGYCTLYAVSNPENLQKYKDLALPISAFAPEGKDLSDCIVVSPKTVPEGYSKVVYLDKPLGFFNGVDGVCFNALKGYNYVDKLSVDRSDFTQAFSLLRSLCGKEFLSPAVAYESYSHDINGYQFIFATQVFLELGIFYIQDGRLYQDVKIKNALTNSKVYSKISLIKVGLC